MSTAPPRLKLGWSGSAGYLPSVLGLRWKPDLLRTRSFNARPRQLLGCSLAHPRLFTSSNMGNRKLPKLPLFEAISNHDPDSIAVVHSLSNRTFKYGPLLSNVAHTRDRLLESVGKQPNQDLSGKRVAFLVENGYDYIVTLLAIFAARAIAVPLSPAFPPAEHEYILNQSQALLFCSSHKFLSTAKAALKTNLEHPPYFLELEKQLGIATTTTNDVELSGNADESGMMLYTSGTTSRPKGVLLPSSALAAQSASLIEAWDYRPADRLLHVLPLHHIHGTVNGLLTPLFAGCSIEFLFPFHADAVWSRLAAPFLSKSTLSTTDPCDQSRATITFFTAVPTVYTRLLSRFPALSSDTQVAARTAITASHLRLAISGSAALPTPLQRAWTQLSGGNALLERYGMTEVGMALSCGLHPADRVDGAVGWPLPGVQARLVDLDDGVTVVKEEEALSIVEAAAADSSHATSATSTTTENDIDSSGTAGSSVAPDTRRTARERPGELQLRGATLFREYFRNPTATASEFTPADPADPDQRPWFKTGDVALRRRVERPVAPVSSSLPSSSAPVTTDIDTGSSPAVGSGASGAWARGCTVFFILGRKSADIIKSGGEKVSALEVERELLALPQVAEAAVVAVPSGRWGHKVACVLVLKADGDTGVSLGTENADHGSAKPANALKPSSFSLLDMRRALKSKLANYKLPQVMKIVPQIPRNAMGKVNKAALVATVFQDDASGDEAGR